MIIHKKNETESGSMVDNIITAKVGLQSYQNSELAALLQDKAQSISSAAISTVIQNDAEALTGYIHNMDPVQESKTSDAYLDSNLHDVEKYQPIMVALQRFQHAASSSQRQTAVSALSTALSAQPNTAYPMEVTRYVVAASKALQDRTEYPLEDDKLIALENESHERLNRFTTDTDNMKSYWEETNLFKFLENFNINPQSPQLSFVNFQKAVKDDVAGIEGSYPGLLDKADVDTFVDALGLGMLGLKNFKYIDMSKNIAYQQLGVLASHFMQRLSEDDPNEAYKIDQNPSGLLPFIIQGLITENQTLGFWDAVRIGEIKVVLHKVVMSDWRKWIVKLGAKYGAHFDERVHAASTSFPMMTQAPTEVALGAKPNEVVDGSETATGDDLSDSSVSGNRSSPGDDTRPAGSPTDELENILQAMQGSAQQRIDSRVEMSTSPALQSGSEGGAPTTRHSGVAMSGQPDTASDMTDLRREDGKQSVARDHGDGLVPDGRLQSGLELFNDDRGDHSEQGDPADNSGGWRSWGYGWILSGAQVLGHAVGYVGAFLKRDLQEDKLQANKLPGAGDAVRAPVVRISHKYGALQTAQHVQFNQSVMAMVHTINAAVGLSPVQVARLTLMGHDMFRRKAPIFKRRLSPEGGSRALTSSTYKVSMTALQKWLGSELGLSDQQRSRLMSSQEPPAGMTSVSVAQPARQSSTRRASVLRRALQKAGLTRTRVVNFLSSKPQWQRIISKVIVGMGTEGTAGLVVSAIGGVCLSTGLITTVSGAAIPLGITGLIVGVALLMHAGFRYRNTNKIRRAPSADAQAVTADTFSQVAAGPVTLVEECAVTHNLQPALREGRHEEEGYDGEDEDLDSAATDTDEDYASGLEDPDSGSESEDDGDFVSVEASDDPDDKDYDSGRSNAASIS